MPGARLSKVPTDSPVSRLVLAVRRKRHWTQRDMAYHLGGISIATVARWEAGLHEPTPATCVLLKHWLTEGVQQAA